VQVSKSKHDNNLNLYEDAKRLKAKNIKKKEELDKIRDHPKEKQFKNDQMDKYVISKFEKDFSLVI
jgi:hypothetical protein